MLVYSTTEWMVVLNKTVLKEVWVARPLQKAHRCNTGKLVQHKSRQWQTSNSFRVFLKSYLNMYLGRARGEGGKVVRSIWLIFLDLG